MAGSYSDFLENTTLDEIFGATNYAPPATLYIALFTARGTDAQSDANTNFTEVTGGAYARKAVTNNSTNWPAASAGAKSNGVAQTMGPATGANWGAITAFGVYDASSAGNLLAWADLTVSKTILDGDSLSFPIGAIAITAT